MRTHCITIDLANQGRRQVRARFDGGRMSSDGGALLLQAVDQRIGLTRRLAACFVDHRNPRRCEHSLQRWPRVRVVVRGDAGFCRDELEPQAAGGGQGGVAAGRGARGHGEPDQ